MLHMSHVRMSHEWYVLYLYEIWTIWVTNYIREYGGVMLHMNHELQESRIICAISIWVKNYTSQESYERVWRRLGHVANESRTIWVTGDPRSPFESWSIWNTSCMGEYCGDGVMLHMSHELYEARAICAIHMSHEIYESWTIVESTFELWSCDTQECVMSHRWMSQVSCACVYMHDVPNTLLEFVLAICSRHSICLRFVHSHYLLAICLPTKSAICSIADLRAERQHMCRRWISHVAHGNESCRICECVVSRMCVCTCMTYCTRAWRWWSWCSICWRTSIVCWRWICIGEE